MSSSKSFQNEIFLPGECLEIYGNWSKGCTSSTTVTQSNKSLRERYGK